MAEFDGNGALNGWREAVHRLYEQVKAKLEL